MRTCFWRWDGRCQKTPSDKPKVPKNAQGIFHEFAGLQGTRSYNSALRWEEKPTSGSFCRSRGRSASKWRCRLVPHENRAIFRFMPPEHDAEHLLHMRHVRASIARQVVLVPLLRACFSGVHCRNCGYTGAGSEFAGDVCPGCGRNPFTGARPGGSKPGQADGSMVAVGCGVPAGIGLLAFGILAGTSSGCAAVSIVAGLILILVPLGFRFLGKASERDAPRNRTYGKTGEEEPLPVFRTPPSPGPCPFPAIPENGGRIRSPGNLIPHGWSWDAGVRARRLGHNPVHRFRRHVRIHDLCPFREERERLEGQNRRQPP